jgi:ATP:ADP antiporter, AAA family
VSQASQRVASESIARSDRFVDVRRTSEAAIAIWGAISFGAVLASSSAFRPVRDALILEGDLDQIPWAFTATLVAVSAVSPLWSALLARRSPRRLVPIAYHVFAACELAFVVAVAADIAPVWVGRVFYVWSAVFNLFVVSVLWSLFADLLGPEIAQRLYGPIAVGGTVGTVVGPALTKLLVGTIGVPGVLAMSAVFLELAVVAIGRVRAAAGELPTAREPRPSSEGGALSGLAHVVRSPYLGAIVGYVLCTACAATFVYLQQARITHDAFPDRAARTDFLATIDLIVAAVTAVIQWRVAPAVLGRLGPGIVLCALPIAQAIGISTLAVAPSLTALVIVAIIGRSATHGLTRPARELLFTVVSRDDKYRAKNAIDTVGYRFGDFASSWLGLAVMGAGGIAVVGTTGPLVVGWLALAVFLGAGFRARKELS